MPLLHSKFCRCLQVTPFCTRPHPPHLQLFWNGGGSPLQELEQKWFVAGGLQPNEAVAKLMETLKAGQPADKSGPLFTPSDSNSTTSS